MAVAIAGKPPVRTFSLKRLLLIIIVLSISPEEKVGILVIGEPGSGKTTLVRNTFGDSESQDCDSRLDSLTIAKGTGKNTPVTVYDASGVEAARIQNGWKWVWATSD